MSMLAALGGFLKTLVDVVPRLKDLYKTGKYEDEIISLFESFYIIGQVVNDADQLLHLVRDKKVLVFSELTNEELEKDYFLVQSVLTLQLQRFKRLDEILLSSSVFELMDFEVQNQLKNAIGNKSEGIFSIGAALFFNQIFGSAVKADETERERHIRLTTDKYEFASSISNVSGISVVEQIELVESLKKLRKQYGEILNDFVGAQQKVLLASKGKACANKYLVRF